MDTQDLIEHLKTRGVRLRLMDDQIYAEASQEPDSYTKALIDELGDHREEVKAILVASINPFACAKKYLSKPKGTPASSKAASVKENDVLDPTRAEVVQEIRTETGELRAAEICSYTLQAHIWMVRDRSFEPRDGLAVYYEEEIPLLKGKSQEDLKMIHNFKVIFPGCRLLQGGPGKNSGALEHKRNHRETPSEKLQGEKA